MTVSTITLVCLAGQNLCKFYLKRYYQSLGQTAQSVSFMIGFLTSPPPSRIENEKCCKKQIRRNSFFDSNGIEEKKRPVVVCGWYGTETLGDKAILGQIVLDLRRAFPDRPVHVASLYPHLTRVTKQQMPELADVDIVCIDDAIARARSCYAMVFGGGPLMGLDELLHMRALFEGASSAGRPCIVAGCGVGPFVSRRYEPIIRDILRLANVRDLSRCAIETEGGRSRCRNSCR